MPAGTTADIVAHAIVEAKDGTPWRAFAVMDADIDEFRLYIENRGVPVMSGTYKHAKAMSKVVHHMMAEKFPGQKARVDTFGALGTTLAGSVVPKCLGKYWETSKTSPDSCDRCPYVPTCSADLVIETTEVEQESAEVLQQRIQVKLRARYGEFNA